MPTTRLATIWHVNDKSLSVRQTNPIANVLRYKSLSSLCWCVYCTFHDYLQKLNWTHECTKLNMWSLVSKRTWIFPSVRRPLSALSMRIFLTEDSLQKMFRAWTKPRWKHLFVQLYRMPEVTNVKIWSRVYTRASIDFYLTFNEKPYCAWTLNPRPHSQAVVAVIPDRFSLKACRGPISQGC